MIAAKQDNFDKAYEKALKLLGVRMHTSFEVRQKLQRRGFATELVEQVIARLLEERYLNDSDTAESYLLSLMRQKTFGFYGLKAKLLQKGIAQDLIESLLAEHVTLEAEEKLAQKYLEKTKKIGTKAAMGLRQKGFRGEVVNRLILG